MKIKLPILIAAIILIVFGLYQKPEQEEVSIPKRMSISLSGIEFRVSRIMDTPALIRKGLSGVESINFSNTDIALFIHDNEEEQQYWMPNTLFPLCIVFVDVNGLIVGKEELDNYPALSTEKNKNEIPRTKIYKSKYVIEMKKGSSVSEFFTLGDSIKINRLPLKEID